MTCAGCHGALATLQNVQNGANNPAAITRGINGRAEMASYKGVFTAQQLADMAAFIAAPF